MPHDDEEIMATEPESGATVPRRFRKRYVAAGLLLVLALLAAWAWFSRERIADDFVSSQLEQMGLPATYEIERIGTDRQVLRNVVIGDPDRPDLTIETATVRTRIGFGLPGIGRITLTRPRLYGTLKEGTLSFGSLDPLIFTDSKEPFQLPNLDLEIVDGRGLLQADVGDIGMKVSGKGPLRGGFAGEIAAVAPRLAYQGCVARDASIYGQIKVAAEKPRFDGPVRLERLDCPDQGLTAQDAGIALGLTLDHRLDGGEGTADLKTGPLALAGSRLASADGETRFVYRDDALTARYDLTGKSIATTAAKAGRLGLSGQVRTSQGFDRVEVRGEVEGGDIALGPHADAALTAARDASDGTLAQPLIGRIVTALRREARGSTLSGDYDVRMTGDVTSIVVPRAALRGGSGATLVSLSRIQFRSDGAGQPRLLGNFATGGQDLPQLTGRMEQRAGRPLLLRVRMPEYRAGDAEIALPELLVVQGDQGGLGFAGSAVLSGPLPGGRAQNLTIPLDGNWSSAGGLAVWRKCVEFRFDRLELADLTLTRRALPVCPARGQPVLSYGPQGLKLAGGVPALDLSGSLGETPIRIQSGPAGFAMPGTLVARDLDVRLGPADTASRFAVSGLKAQLGGELAGTFEGADVLLDAVPLDILDAHGGWRFVNGELLLSDGQFRLEDRERIARFEPLIARDATLQLADNVITAAADMREPESDRVIVAIDLRHDLATAGGHADLDVAGILFDEQLQPDTLSGLALGVIANAEGIVRGQGRIDWDEEDVTSSGSFSTNSFDFAAAFGPVQGVSGTVRFTDLLGLVTAPDQKLNIAAINPGIEVTDGVLTFEMRPDYVLEIDGARWPFLEGTLVLEPVTMEIGSDGDLRYTLVIDGLNAARFVEQMELGNLAATGTFDGVLPLVFDQDGGRIEGGSLKSRLPGGNVSYVGELTYEDLSTMANFAFDALRSIDYREMTIAMDGELEGELVTRVRFYGVSQGEGTSSNFVTRQISKLPVQFNINLRAPFMQLITSFKSFYDPELVRDPRSLGLIDTHGAPMPRTGSTTSIQPSESGNIP